MALLMCASSDQVEVVGRSWEAVRLPQVGRRLDLGRIHAVLPCRKARQTDYPIG